MSFPAFEYERFETVCKLLEDAKVKELVEDFLKERGLAFSADNWPQFKSKRLLSGVQEGHFTVDDLLALLAEVEEYGRNHVFLFQLPASEAKKLISEDHIRKVCSVLGIESLIEHPQVLDVPDSATLTEINWFKEKRGECVRFKIIDQRKKSLGAVQEAMISEDGQIYEVKKRPVAYVRGVNTVRLYEFGLLEVKIQSHDWSSRYHEDLNKVWRIIGDFIPEKHIEEIPAKRTAIRILCERKKYEGVIRISPPALRNRLGFGIRTTSRSPDQGIWGVKALANAVDEFVKDDVECEESRFYWIANKSGSPTRDIHVVFSGLSNEFAILGKCSKLDYEFVLDQIREISA